MTLLSFYEWYKTSTVSIQRKSLWTNWWSSDGVTPGATHGEHIYRFERGETRKGGQVTIIFYKRYVDDTLPAVKDNNTF